MELEQKSNGALIGSIIIFIILIIGGIYLWRTVPKEKTAPNNSEIENVVGTFDNTVNLEADINSINLENLDEGL